MNKPINIVYELVIITILIVAGVVSSVYSKHETSWLLAIILFVYAAGIVSITMRTLVTKQRDRLSISVFFFGLSCGICYGVLLCFMSPDVSKLHFILILFGIIAWGIAAGVIAVLSSYIISLSFINDLKSLLSRNKKA